MLILFAVKLIINHHLVVLLFTLVVAPVLDKNYEDEIHGMYKELRTNYIEM